MRPNTMRARALMVAGAVGTTMLTGGAAVAQTEAPSVGAAAAAPAPSRIAVTAKRLNVRAGRSVVVRGVLRPRQAQRIVRLERLSRGRWRQIDGALTTSTGRFTLRYRTRGVDTSLLRLRFRGDRTAKASSRGIGRLNAFRPALASWYGPGLYGNALGCGGRLSPGTVGVAHKSLPCGTKLVLRKGSRIVRARVIDRGPYVGGREFDLTAATKYRLGFGSTGTVWVAH